MLIVASHIALAIPGNTIYVYVMARYTVIKHGIGDIRSPRRLIDVTVFLCRSISEQAAFHFTSNLTLRCVMYILHVLNYSINILLYCVANKTIRKEAYRRLSSIFNCKNLYWREWYETTIRRSGKP